MTDETTEPLEEPVLVTRSVTCHTDGCGNAGIAIALSMTEDAAVACGVCGQPITDVGSE
jgi:hypothetical protein